MASSPAEDDEYVPLIEQRVFGAGIKRKRIDFVPASSPETSLPSSFPAKPSNTGNLYLSIVLPKATPTEAAEEEKQSGLVNPRVCAVCNQPMAAPVGTISANAHELSIAHQVCLDHSHPPSHLDRAHVGVKYMTAYGWDVDGRRGLGAREEGIRIPIKVKEKTDTAGLREAIDEDGAIKSNKKPTMVKKDKPIFLNAKELRRKDDEDKRRAQRLQQSFYGPDLEHYLGPNS